MIKERIPENRLNKLWAAVLKQTWDDALENKKDYAYIRLGPVRYKWTNGKLRKLSPMQFKRRRIMSMNISTARTFFLEPNQDLDFCCDAANLDKERVLSIVVPKILKQIEEESNG